MRNVYMRLFLDMGGYGAYIWPAYLISALVLTLLTISIWRRGKALAEQLRRAQKIDRTDFH